MENKADSSLEKLTKCLLIAALLILAISFILLIYYYTTSVSAKKQYEALRETYVQEPDRPKSSSPAPPSSDNPPELSESDEPEDLFVWDDLSGYGVPEKIIDFAALQEEVNPDIYAWITIPDTQIDYPILQHPTDMSYYLEHNLDGSTGRPGCIYTELRSSKTWEDVNTVIYGHNMRDGSMFAGLHEYEDEAFFEEHPYIYIYSPDSVRVYQIFAAYEFSDKHLAIACDWEDPESVAEYLSQIYEYPGIFDTEVSADGDSQLLTLSTCISGKSDKRFLVQAVLAARGIMIQ